MSYRYVKAAASFRHLLILESYLELFNDSKTHIKKY